MKDEKQEPQEEPTGQYEAPEADDLSTEEAPSSTAAGETGD